MNALMIGTFDPFTIGHYELYRQASQLFTTYIAVTENPKKKRRFDVDRCTNIIQKLTGTGEITEDFLGISVIEKYNCEYLIRGVRDTADWIYEEKIANMYKEVLPSLNIIYFKTTTNISSTLVYELYQRGDNIDKWLPYSVKLLEDK